MVCKFCMLDVGSIPVTMLISSSWLRLLDEPSDKLELAELNGCSDGHGDGGPPNRNNVVAPHPIPDRRRGLYRGGPRNGTAQWNRRKQIDGFCIVYDECVVMRFISFGSIDSVLLFS